MAESIKKKLNVLGTVLVILSALICVLLAGKVLQGQEVSLFGYRLCSVLTGSMEPTIPVGATVLIHEVDPSTLQVGDVITFTSHDAVINGQNNTHRIVAVEQDETGALRFVTQGDANSAQDQNAVQVSDLKGKMVLCIRTDTLSNIWKFLCTKAGFVSVIVLPMMLLTGYFMRDFRRQVQLLTEEKAKEEQDTPKE